MAKYRRLSRMIALQTLTALLLRNELQQGNADKIEECFSYVKKEFAPELQHQDDFAKSLVHETLERQHELDTKIVEFAPEWPIEKLSPVERVILELGACELVFHPETPLPVIINEWVDIAKEFGDDTAGKFVNGVLSNLGNDVRTEEKSKESLEESDEKS